MKKILLLAAVFTILVNTLSAQKTDKCFLAFTGGPSFAIGDFGSTNVYNVSAGLAKTGYNFNMHFGYQLQKNFGIASTLLYSKHNLAQDAIIQIDPGLSGDHWQYYGVTAGPMITASVSPKTSFDFKIMGGATNVNMPVLSYEGYSSEEKWAGTFAWQLGMDLRYNFGRKTCFFANVDYTSMKPKTTVNSVDMEQKIDVINANVGIGITF